MRLKWPGPWPDCGREGGREGGGGGRVSTVTDVGLEVLLYYNFQGRVEGGKIR